MSETGIRMGPGGGYIVEGCTIVMTDADRLTTLEAAVREVVRLVNVYLPPDTEMTHKDFVSGVAGAVDNARVFEALEKVK